MDSLDRHSLRNDLYQRLKIEEAHDGVRLVTLDGIILGRLGWDKETKRWGLQVRAGWLPNATELEAPDAEYAETWACEEVADWLAGERRPYEEAKPWGEKKPPGVK